jgi:hypothetical protein
MILKEWIPKIKFLTNKIHCCTYRYFDSVDSNLCVFTFDFLYRCDVCIFFKIHQLCTALYNSETNVITIPKTHQCTGQELWNRQHRWRNYKSIWVLKSLDVPIEITNYNLQNVMFEPHFILSDIYATVRSSLRSSFQIIKENSK